MWTTALGDDELLTGGELPGVGRAVRVRDRGVRPPSWRLRDRRRGRRGRARPTTIGSARCAHRPVRPRRDARCAPRPPRRRVAGARVDEVDAGGDRASCRSRTWSRSRPTCTARPPTGAGWARPWSAQRLADGQSRRRGMAEIGIEVTVNGQRPPGDRRAAADPRRLPPRALPASPAPTSAASTASAARAPCCSTARRCAPAWSSRCRPTAGRSRPSRASPSPDGDAVAVQAAFREHHGLQCGFCTPGFVTSA